MYQANLSLQDITDPRFRSICEKILEKMEKHQVPGMSIGILCDGVAYTAGLGITHIDHPLPVTSDTLFQIGSTTKTFTAIAVMRLVEQGKLDLDTPIKTYLPDLKFADPDVTEKVTMRHLLTHTGGWLGDHFQDFGWGDDNLAKYVASLETIPQLTPLGEVWSYNNAGFVLAGRVIEVITGKTYEAAMQELLLEPLGLKRSYFFMQDVMNQRFATGHNNDPVTQKLSIANPWPIGRFANPAGGITADVHDQLKYARFVMSDGTAADGTRLLKKETLELMQTPQVDIGGALGDYVGLSFMLRDYAGVKIVSHGGSTNGQQSSFETIPEKQFAVILLTNAGNGATLNHEILPEIIDAFLGIRPEKKEHPKFSADKAAEYAGVYQARQATLTLTVGDDCNLVIKFEPEKDPTSDEPVPEIPLIHTEFVDENKIITLDGPIAGLIADFVRGPEKEIRWFRFGGRIAKRL